MKGWVKFGLISLSIIGLVWGCVAYSTNKSNKKKQQEITDIINEPCFYVDHFGLVHLDKECWAINEMPTMADIDGDNATININICEQPLFNVHAIRFIPKNNWDSTFKYFCLNEVFCSQCCTPQLIEGVKSTFVFPTNDEDRKVAMPPHIRELCDSLAKENCAKILQQMVDSNFTTGKFDNKHSDH